MVQFILDGYDEISPEKRDYIKDQILTHSNTFNNCRFVVSSRYDELFVGWQNFDIVKSLPFSYKNTLELINKVPFREETKELFKELMTVQFFEKHKDFLANPLLAIMMLMIFRDNRNIPKDMNVFYEQAFTTLYQRQDYTKAFKRDKTLDMIQFQRSFGTFCLITYSEEKFQFTKSEVIDYISKSNEMCKITENPENILNDYVETVNLLMQEGLYYVFIHRSFHEYFSAYAIIKLYPDKFLEIIESIKYWHQDKIIQFCFEMNKKIFINKYINKKYPEFTELINLERNEKFYFLDLIDFEIHFNIINNASNKYFDIFNSVSSPHFARWAHQDFGKFVMLVNNIRGKKTVIFEITSDILINKEFLDLDYYIRQILNETKIRICILTFKANDIDVELDDDDQNCNNIKNKIICILNKYKYLFENINNNMKNEIVDLCKWCEEEISKCKGQAESLTDILKLS